MLLLAWRQLRFFHPLGETIKMSASPATARHEGRFSMASFTDSGEKQYFFSETCNIFLLTGYKEKEDKQAPVYNFWAIMQHMVYHIIGHIPYVVLKRYTQIDFW